MNNLKKVISSVAALAMVASTATALAAFPDVDASATYAQAVDTLQALKIVEGDENGKFNPDANVTRAEFTKMVVEARGDGDAASALTNSKFADVAGHWAAGYIAQGVSVGFIQGYDENTFGPNDQVTYAQAITMLVRAIGYDTYATQQGGFPAGYMTQGSSLKLTSGISGVNNDTPLTRAQCATAIYNALKAPVALVDGYDTVADGRGGWVQVPNIEPQDGLGDEYQTLLTKYHNAYVVKGRVMETAKGDSSLDKGEVKFRVESADNFDDTSYGNSSKYDETAVTETMHADGTNAENMQFSYAEAIVQKDEDTDEWTILAINEYGKSKTLPVAADDVSKDDTTATKLAVYKSANSNTTTKHDLDPNCVVYVNGSEVGEFSSLSEADLDDYIYENTTGTITLVDATDQGTTSTDGKYDYMMIDYYLDAVVDYVTTTSSNARVYLKTYDPSKLTNQISWDPEDEDANITFTLDGNEIDYNELQEWDVLSIAYDVANNGKDYLKGNFDYVDVQVARNTVTGKLTGRDTDEDILKIDGNEYDLVTSLTSTADSYDLNTEYTLYLDKFGYVAYVDEGNSEKNYGIVVGMYTSAGNDYATVRMITSDAQIVAYECKDKTAQDEFYALVTGQETATYPANTTISKNTINTTVGFDKTVVEYQLTNGKLKLKTKMSGVGGADKEYKASTEKIGSYTITEGVTKLVDMDAYINNDDNTVSTLTTASLEDGATYTAYLYDRNSAGDYRFGFIKDGISSLRPDSTLAVVKQNNGQTTNNDGDDCTMLTVYRANQEVTVLIDDPDYTIAEGSVIAYATPSNGTVDSSKVEVIFEPSNDYDAMKADTVAKTNFADMLNTGVCDVATDDGGYVMKLGGKTTSAKDVYGYFGVMYRTNNKGFELFTGKDANAQSGIGETTDFSITSDTNLVIYDYSQRTNKGARAELSTSVPTQNKSVFNSVLAGSDDEYVDWNAVAGAGDECEPKLVFVRTVDDDVTDVVVYSAP